MRLIIKGNMVQVFLEATESTNHTVKITLPNGYSYETIRILYLDNITEIAPFCPVSSGNAYHFPTINSCSPSILNLWVSDGSKVATIRFSIEKFGQIPDPNYFDNAFEPILVTGDDGNEYKMIPSDQFK